MGQWVPHHTKRAAKALDALLEPEPKPSEVPTQISNRPTLSTVPKRSLLARLGALFRRN